MKTLRTASKNSPASLSQLGDRPAGQAVGSALLTLTLAFVALLKGLTKQQFQSGCDQMADANDMIFLLRTSIPYVSLEVLDVYRSHFRHYLKHE